jgi:hypothetical protein
MEHKQMDDADRLRALDEQGLAPTLSEGPTGITPSVVPGSS